jgi:hypothetical protein
MTSGASESVPDSSEFALRLKSVLARTGEACIDPEYLFLNVREVKSTQPLLGYIKDSEHQEGGSFILFRRQEREEIALPPPEMPIPKPGNPLVASGALNIKTATAGHLSILINNTRWDMGDLPDYATLPVSEISAGNIEKPMVYADGHTEKQTVIVEPDKTAEVNFSYRPSASSAPTISTPAPSPRPVPPADFSSWERSGTWSLNLFVPGLGSYVIMKDWLGGSLILGSEVLGIVLLAVGASQTKEEQYRNYFGISQYYVTTRTVPDPNSGLMITGGILLGAGFVFNIVRSITYHKPQSRTASLADPRAWDIALLPGENGRVTKVRLTYTLCY